MQISTKPLASLLATILVMGLGFASLPHGKKKEDTICVLKPENIHISKHEITNNDSNALKIKVSTVCSKRQIETRIDTQMFEIIDGKEHMTIPFDSVKKTSAAGSLTFYFKNILHECMNSRPTVYIAHIQANIELEDHSIQKLKRKSSKSISLKCGLY
jgi:hypothetical protein